MYRISIVLLAFVIVSLRAGADVEDVLLQKFDQQKKLQAERVRAFVTDNVKRATEVKESNPEQGLQLLREAAARLDAATQLTYEDRKTMRETLAPLVGEMRALILLRKRELAANRIDAFKEYLELIAPDMPYPGRSGDDHWEPAMFTTPNGQSQPGRLMALGSGSVSFKFGREDRTAPPTLFPWIQVFGGCYVYDFTMNYHVFLTNVDFADKVLFRLARDYFQTDPRLKAIEARGDFTRARNDPRLEKEIRSGVFFLRGVPDELPIPALGDRESDFLEFAAQRIMHKGLPLPASQIYPRDLTETFANLSWAQKSTINRSLFLARAKGLGTSKLYPEILREETANVVRTESPNFAEGDINRVLVYLFDKLR